jgi:flavin reductase (DIM6/NTAB) family NADH-FMN oxidoreductase RutF
VTQAKDVWLLGDKYSGYTAEVGGTSKMDAVRSEVEVFPDSDVPILRGCIAWCYCEVEFEVEGLAGDHGVFIASVKRAIGDATVMQTDGDYKSVPTPLMQVVRNRFATTGSAFDLDWLGKEHR